MLNSGDQYVFGEQIANASKIANKRNETYCMSFAYQPNCQIIGLVKGENAW